MVLGGVTNLPAVAENAGPSVAGRVGIAIASCGAVG